MRSTSALARQSSAADSDLLDVVLPYVRSELLGLIGSFFEGVWVNVLPVVL